MTQGQSRTITTNQDGIHPDIEKVVLKHLEHSFQHKVKQVSLEIFREIDTAWQLHGGDIIFDSGCGTGESTIAIAKQNPDCLVIGMDKSAERVRKAANKFEDGINYLLVRAEVIDIWRLAVEAGWQLKTHYILYPNPWPKKSHLKRRWHGHPVFTDLLKLGGEVILRSNWKLYLEEFAQALKIATGSSARIYSISPETHISLFEKKYAESGQKLYELRVKLT